MAADNDPESGMIEWYWPGRYPSRCNNAFAEAVAWDVAGGAGLEAAVCRQGVSPKRAKQWLRWGEDAYFRDADENDTSAEYLNFYLKVMQAVGIAAVPVQQRLYRANPQWWLSHHPEARAGWTEDTAETPLLAAPETPDRAAEAAASALQPLPVPDMREVIKTLMDSGAFLPQKPSPPSGEPSVPADGQWREEAS